jgi:hypothetical protein
LHEVVVPTTCNLDSIYVSLAEAPNAAQTYTVFLNGLSSGLACSVGGTGSMCSTTGFLLLVPSGSLLTVQFTGSQGSTQHGTVSVHCG